MEDDTTNESRHISVWVGVAPDIAYAFAADPDRLPEWAAGLADDELRTATVEFTPRNDLGVLDHVVTLPSGQVFYNPLRIIPVGGGESRCEVVVTLRRQPEMSDEQFEADAAAVAADLQTLRRLLETEQR